MATERHEGAGCEPSGSYSSDPPELSTLHMRLAADVDLKEVVDTMKAHRWKPLTQEEGTWYGIGSAEAGEAILAKDMKGRGYTS
ncbi:hypothetical protein DP939_35535 [Spongiactinospora rosea]|uniref:Uncharacterized protein n=1 Tax=Spongiactinospora rosea TaxID=2248750 RepID=A0A366LN87_9ACTN|nr:hypothetical protein DP939_35535 [Spongiactinospora rosea]